MNDPRVVSLIYRVEHGDTVNYDKTEPLHLENSEFCLTVENKQAQFDLKNHFATESEAREAMNGHVRAWEFDACLSKNDPEYFRLKFDRSVIEDRNPTPGVTEVNAQPINLHIHILPASVTVSPPKYPSPPSDVMLDADVETMFQRCMGYFGGPYRNRRGENLTSMAYFCLTVLEGTTQGKRQEAATKYGISTTGLNRIGRLSSEKGGPHGARKGEGVSSNLTPKERHFLEEAVKKIIRRAAEKVHDPDTSSETITMSDLPSLEETP